MMKAEPVHLDYVFGSDRRHIVPIFQRPYVWKQSENWAPLLEDVRKAAEEVEREQAGTSLSQGQPRTHFLGALVLERTPVAPGRLTAFNVIDGQQRLTTLQILLASAKAVSRALGAEQADAVLGTLTANREALVHPEHGYERYKVWPSLSDRDAFKSIFSSRQDNLEHRDHLVSQARQYFDGELTTWAEAAPDPISRLNALVIAIRQRVGLVEIVLEDSDDPQVIFETLNDRGTRLLASDLVKNTILRRAESEGADVEMLHEKYWRPFVSGQWREVVTTGRIQRERLDLLLAYWLTIKTGMEIPVERLFTEFRAWIGRSSLTSEEILADLDHHGRALIALENLQPTNPTGHARQVLQLLTITTPLPLLLHLQARPGVSEAQRDFAAAALESFIVRRMVCGLSTNDYNRLLLSVLQNIRNCDDAVAGELVAKLLSTQTAISRYWPGDEEFYEGLRATNLYRALRGPRMRVLLGGLETKLRRSKSEQLFAPAQVEKLTVEHLLPQKWSANYPLPTDRAIEDAEDRRARALHQLGNLTLTTSKLNSTLSNGSWFAKRRELNKHAVLLVTSGSVLEPPDSVPPLLASRWSDGWTEDHVEFRSHYLASIALTTWNGPQQIE